MQNNQKKVLIVGATGMAGHMIYNHLDTQGKYILHNTVFRSKLTNNSIICDVRNKDEITKIIQTIKPDFIVNCVGALIKESQTNPDNAILLNAWFPHFLKSLAFQSNSQLIHISTDCVFSGERGDYKVDDFRDADDIYGRSKAIGELVNADDVTIRTSIIGPELKDNGEGLLHWFLSQTRIVNGFTNVFWSGITTLELAKQVEKIINNYTPGVFNLAPATKISKYELLLLIKKIFNKSTTIEPLANKQSDKSLIPSKDFTAPNYTAMLDELQSYMQHNKEQYKRYL